MSKRRCRDCPSLVPSDAPAGRCKSCRSKRERARGTRQQRGYDADYDRVHRDYQRRMDGGEAFVCWRCLEEKGITHHVDPRPGRWHLGHDDNDRTIIRGPECPAGNLATAQRQGPVDNPGGTPRTPVR